MQNKLLRPPAIVLSLFDTGLGAIRSLGREGVPVIGMDSDLSKPGFKSRYCKAMLCPDPVRQSRELLEFMLELGRTFEHPGILFPASDAFVLFVSRNRDKLCSYFRFNLPSETIMETIANKRLQYELARTVNTHCPDTWYPQTIEEVGSIKNMIDYPAFIKPYYSHLWREVFPTKKGIKVHSPQELLTAFEEILPTGLQVMVQSLIIGPNTNHYKVNVYMDSRGVPLAHFTLRKIRQFPVEFGIGSLVESIHDNELLECGLRFFREIGYRGIGSIEFKKDERDGRLKMIELNPRLWQQNYLATVCGINFPLVQYLDLTGQAPQPVSEFPDKVKWFDEFADFKSYWEYSRRKELSFFRWLLSMKGVKAHATFAVDDMGPFLSKNGYGMKYLRLPLYIFKRSRMT